ncbi:MULTISPECIES: NAD(P)/FAD-dependent oxidoreductase [unclassified Paenibacillus]|uniref:dihydrolipoyl dehydrogenase family protein n=1 Tax=unclassified Paenibacillus TaxID=185978 RepID=UPI000957022B|nr:MULTISPECIES: NAD(P)/FAD-dependent oxidoreductase [unclassified Paenibacillus]ASS68293.1 NAD(P)/FAD-dependent oxidoreductase [Paenibacillus sp. RUD330]SIR27859.1 glutathione reductase (NADPH) [Paenibacillus sp. RU4X]SIR40336.1 glutathione reductase (NADPH) [Paenibacillus sp. RU4T]
MSTGTHEYDLVVVGSGTAGASAAHRCREAGWKVALVENRPLGGTCALRGCDPKKVLAGAAELVDWNRRMKGKGATGDVSISWPELMAFKNGFIEGVPESREKEFREAGIEVWKGTAKFAAEDIIEVGDAKLKGRHILLATGARPAPLGIEGGELLATSDDFLELEELPEEIVFIGGGYISFEFAHMAARAGAKVHILHRGKRPLSGFDPDLADRLVQATEAIGVDIHLEAAVQSVTREPGGGLTVHAQKDGKPVKLACGLAVHGAGRIANVEDLELRRGSVEGGGAGIKVHPWLQSVSNPRVYAAGDCADTEGPPLTPISSVESAAAARNMLQGSREEPDYRGVPTVVFTVPKLASVGLSEKQAQERGLNAAVNKLDASSWYTYKRTNEQAAMMKVILDADSGKVLGAHLLGSTADELVNHFAAAIRFGLTGKDISSVLFAYPSAASDLTYLVQGKE